MARPQPRYHLHNKTQQKGLGKQRLAEVAGARGRSELSLVGVVWTDTALSLDSGAMTWLPLQARDR